MPPTREELLAELKKLESRHSTLDSGLQAVVRSRIAEIKTLLDGSQGRFNESWVVRVPSRTSKGC